MKTWRSGRNFIVVVVARRPLRGLSKQVAPQRPIAFSMSVNFKSTPKEAFIESFAVFIGNIQLSAKQPHFRPLFGQVNLDLDLSAPNWSVRYRYCARFSGVGGRRLSREIPNHRVDLPLATCSSGLQTRTRTDFSNDPAEASQEVSEERECRDRDQLIWNE